MNLWIRDLNFCAAVMDLALWAMLIANPRRDHQLLLLSGGLGILFTGRAIGGAILQMASQYRSSPISLLGAIVQTTAILCFLYVWWQALRVATNEIKPKVA